MVLTEAPDLSDHNADAKEILNLVTLANEAGGTIVILTNNPVWGQLKRLGMTVRVDPPDEDEMYFIIKAFIDDYRGEITIEWDDADIREAASILAGVTQIEAENLIATLIANKRIQKSDLDQLRYAKDGLFENISGLEKIEVDESVKNLGGVARLRKWLDEKKELLTPEKKAALAQKGLRPPRGILLVGVPGCGKSLSAKAISASWHLPLYRLDFATVQGQYVGQSSSSSKMPLPQQRTFPPAFCGSMKLKRPLWSWRGRQHRRLNPDGRTVLVLAAGMQKTSICGGDCKRRVYAALRIAAERPLR